jgi:rare lipoprotein A (peptidoglycan hydrolase)
VKSEPLIPNEAEQRRLGDQHAHGRDSVRFRRMTLFALVALFGYACTSSKTATPAPQPVPQNERGVASWYGQEFAGRTTANGEIFDPMLFTAAHRTLPFGTVVDIKNPKTNQTVRVRINDRGPYIGNRTIDISYAAAQQISLIEPGSGDVELTVVRVGKGEREPPAPFSVTIGNDTPAPSVASATTTPITALAPSPVPQPPAIVNNVQVETRRQVSPSGKSVETVPLAQPPAPTSIAATRMQPPAPQPSAQPPSQQSGSQPAASSASQPARPATQPKRDVAAAPGHEPAAALDRATHPSMSTRSASSPAAFTPASTPSPTPGGKYVVQVGAFSQEPNAKLLQDRLTRIGQQSYVAHTSLYFVRVGPFATREQAVQVRGKLEAAGISAIVIVP